MIFPLFLYTGALLILILIFRNPGPKGFGVGAAFLALLAFGVGTCSALVGMPIDHSRWPACLGLATLAVFTFVWSLGRDGMKAPPPGTRGSTASINTPLVLLAIAMLVAAFALLLAVER